MPHRASSWRRPPSPARRRVLLGALVAPVAAAAPDQTCIAFDAASLPTQFTDAAGACAGLYPGLVRAALHEMGLRWACRPLPFKRLLGEVRAGSCAGGALVRTAERERFVAYSAAYFDERLLLVVAAVGPLPRDLDALRGRRLALIRGWSYGDALDGALARGEFLGESVTSDRQSLEMLRRGRVDAALITELGWRLQCRLEPAYLQLREAFPISSNGIHLGLPRAWPGTADWLARFDAAMRKVRAGGGEARHIALALQQAVQRVQAEAGR